MRVPIIIIGIVLLAYLGASLYGAIKLMKVPRVPLDDSPASVGLNYEDVSFPSRVDNITLKGWYIPGKGMNTIIMISSGIENRSDPNIGALEISKDLVEKGFSILLFDLRGRGESEGKGVTLTNTNRDIGGAIDYIKSRGCSTSNIILIGFSMGAASTLIFASQEDVAVVISDSSFSNVDKMFIRRGVEERGLPEALIRFLKPGVFLMVGIFYDYSKVNPVDIVADISCPILFIHGEADDTIPAQDAYKLYEASANAKDELLIVPGATHCQAYNTNPAGYIDRVTSFFKGVD